MDLQTESICRYFVESCKFFIVYATIIDEIILSVIYR